MLGGSAPPQTSGAPFRPGSGNRSMAWPPPAHQNDLYGRSYGIYSLFAGPGDHPGTLYTPTAKIAHTGSPFSDYTGAQKVSDSYFSSKFPFGASVPPQFNTGLNASFERDISQLEASTKNFPHEAKSYSPAPLTTKKKCDEHEISSAKESRSKRLSDDVVIIKSELDDVNKRRREEKGKENGGKGEGDAKEGRKIDEGKNGMSHILSNVSEPKAAGVGVVFANEPDSTDFGIRNANQKSYDEPATPEEPTQITCEKREDAQKPNFNNKKESSNKDESEPSKDAENSCKNDKCNINVIDLSTDNQKKKALEKCNLKSESINDICNRLSENKKCVKPKNDSKNLTINCKQSNESSKPSPTRTLSLPHQNGGCSRTTPITFKHVPIHESESKPHSHPMSVEVPQLFIKKEPSDFHKYPSGLPYPSPSSLDSYYSPTMEGQLLSPGRFPDSYHYPSGRKENYLSPTLDPNYLSPRIGQNYLSPRTPSDNPFLSPNIDIESYDSYKNYRPKEADGYLLNGDVPKIPENIFLPQNCLPREEERRIQENSPFLSPTSSTNVEGDNDDKIKKSTSNVATVTPCQVAEVTSATSLLSPKIGSLNPMVVKQETTVFTSVSTTSTVSTVAEEKKEMTFSPNVQSTVTSTGSNIPVGIAVARQRCQRHNEVKISSNNVPPPVVHRAVQSSASIDLSSNVGAAVYSGGVACDDRSTNLITSWPAQPHNPTLWQYSAPIDYPPFPPVGFQLVRDPITGHFLLIPAANIEALQRAILWPSFQPTPPQMIIPPMPPNTQHLLLDANVPAVDFITPESIHHNAPQHRILITTDNSNTKRKMPVIKLETSDCSNTVVVTTCESNNTVYAKAQPVSPTPGHEPVFFPQRQAGANENGRRSQATSPVSCLTPVNDGQITQLESETITPEPQHPQMTMVTLQDASNQTETPLQSEDETSQPPILDKDKFEPYTKVTEQNLKIMKTSDVGTEANIPNEDDKQKILKEIEKRKEAEALKLHISSVPDVNIKKEIISPSQVDLSGLELLSNSIEQFVTVRKTENENVIDGDRKELSNDACEGAVLLQSLKNGFRQIDSKVELEEKSEKHLGGLGLLCALAEQRFREEIGQEEERNEEDCDLNKNELDFNGELSPDDSLSLEDMEMDVKLKLTGLHKKYQELKDSDCISDSSGGSSPKRGPGRPKKFNKILDTPPSSPHSRRMSRKSKEMSPPILEKATDYFYDEDNEILEIAPKLKSKTDILRPPTLTPNTILEPVKSSNQSIKLPHCEVNLVALNIDDEKKIRLSIDESEEPKKRKLSEDGVIKSSSKKRKVGRPKKHFSPTNPLTETIVAKKLKNKSNYLFQPIQVAESLSSGKIAIPEIKNQTDEAPVLESFDLDDKKQRKIRPKLKAEAKVKDYDMPEEEENVEWVKKEENEKKKLKVQIVDDNERKDEKEEEEDDDDDDDDDLVLEKENKENCFPSCVLTTDDLKSDKFPIRTLTVMGGLFYAGQLSAIRAPDVYGITIDGERGHRPHIYSREEILKDSILEVKPESTANLTPGTRVCAYWSEQYRCLYPGTISAPTTPDPELDDKFVNVEFDDGDSGRINLDDIRLLPEDYPIVEYDPNPLQSLSRRKRRISGASVESHSKERKSTDSLPNPEKKEKLGNEEPDESVDKPERDKPGLEPMKNVQVFEPGYISSESERRHLKKKRREKLKRLQSLSVDGKKKHKKRRCSDEHRHHRHHKKHKKHKHKHNKRRISDINEEVKKFEGELEDASKENKEQIRKKNECKSAKKLNGLSEKSKVIKPKKCKERTESVESRSKMAAFLPARQLWGWSGKGYKRPGAKGRAKKEFYKTIQRGKERITVGDCAVFLSTGRPDRPYIGRIESMWESWGTNMVVKVKWFYHPEETVGCPATLEYPGALFESPHVDENDVQTISHKCEVLPLKEYTEKLGNEPHRYETIYDNNDIYYLAGYYDPTNTTLKMEPGVK